METVLRVAVVYVFVLAAMRLLGKRDVGQLTPFDLVMLMLIPDIAQMGMVREDHSITNALIGLGTLFSLTFVNSMACYLWKPAQKVIDGEPTVLFKEGRFFTKLMDRERISVSDIVASMHKSGIEDLSQVKWIILENEGELTYIPKRPGNHAPRPATRRSAVTL